MVCVNCRLSLKLSITFLKAARERSNVEIGKEGRLLIFFSSRFIANGLSGILQKYRDSFLGACI